MAVIYQPTDYLYISARLRAREAGLVGRERLARLSELNSAEEVLSALVSEGILQSGALEDPEAALAALLREAYETVRSGAPDASMFAFLQYPTDCHNVKSVLKCHYRGISHEALLIDAGTLRVEALQSLPEQAPEELPPHMRDAVAQARTAYERSKDPREIDFILDAACFADMQESAAALPLATELVRVRADMINLSTCRRLLQMHAGEAGAATLAHAFLPVGSLEKDALLSLYAAGESAFLEYVAHSAYATVFAGDSPTEIERRADDLYMQIARRAAQVPFGAEVLIGYLIGAEYAVKNLRILLAAKRAGADSRALGRRLRESYV